MSTTRTRTTLATLTRLRPAALILAGVVAGSMFSELFRPAAALAQDSKTLPPDKVLNSAEATFRMANGITQMNERLTRIEAALNAGIKVKVTEMPASSSKDASK